MQKDILLGSYRRYDLSIKELMVPLILFLIGAVVYTLSMTPSVSAGDNGELTTAMHYLGIAHAPGYPLHSFLGKLFTYIPINNVGWRTNFFSAFCGALTIFFAVWVYLKLLLSIGTNKIFAIVSGSLAGIAFMFSKTLWSQSIMCEVYTLSSLFFPIHMLILLKWQDAILSRRIDDIPYFGERFLLAYAFLFGVSLTNHQTTLVTAFYGGAFIVAILVLYVFRNRRLTEKQLSVGLTLVAYLFVCMAIIVFPYAKKIVSLSSNLYIKENVYIGMGAFLGGNILLLLPLLYYKFIAPDEYDAHNYLQRGVLVVIKMLLMFYLGWSILAYMYIRSHGNPPINWMGISEAKEIWLKVGKLWNAVYRKQYGDMGKLPVNLFNYTNQIKLAMTHINGSQFSGPFYVVGVLGMVQLFRKYKLWFFTLLFAFVSYNLFLVYNLRFNFEERDLFFVTVFFIFSYFCMSVAIALGLSFLMEMVQKIVRPLTKDTEPTE